MSTNKVKVVALRLPAAVQQLIKDGAKRSETTQPDFVQAALELAQEDMAVLDRVYERATQIRRDRTRADSVAAADTNAPAFTNYSEEWPLRPIGNEGEYETIWIRWSHDQLDAIAGKFASTDYWYDRFHHWKHAAADDRARLVRDWHIILAGLPVPVRYLCWCVLAGIGGDGFSAVGAGGETLEEHAKAIKASLEFSLFNNLPWPLDNKVDGCKLDLIDKFQSAGKREIGVNGVGNIISPHDLDELLSNTETLQGLDHNSPEPLRRDFGYPVCTFTGGEGIELLLVIGAPPGYVESSAFYPASRFAAFADFAKTTGKKWIDLIPKKYGDLFDEAPLSEQGGDPFTNRPRSKALYMIGFLILAEETIAKFWWDEDATGQVTFADLDERCEVSKAAISKLLTDWNTLFERELTLKGKPKRGGWIKLTKKGREFLDSATIAEGAGLPFDWMDKLLSSLNETAKSPNRTDLSHPNDTRTHWQQWTTNFLANWRQIDACPNARGDGPDSERE